MIASKILPVRPSLESLRKQAKKLAREAAAGKPAAIARVRAQLPGTELPLWQRDAQLVLAREYGFVGWQDLREEVFKRAGKAQEWVTEQAERAVHDNDVERLRQVLPVHTATASTLSGKRPTRDQPALSSSSMPAPRSPRRYGTASSTRGRRDCCGCFGARA